MLSSYVTLILCVNLKATEFRRLWINYTRGTAYYSLGGGILEAWFQVSSSVYGHVSKESDYINMYTE